jgi:hypothetical protein
MCGIGDDRRDRAADDRAETGNCVQPPRGWVGADLGADRLVQSCDLLVPC